jgi:hypothetical protein
MHDGERNTGYGKPHEEDGARNASKGEAHMDYSEANL